MKEQPVSNEISSGHVKNGRRESKQNKAMKENGKTKRDDKDVKLEKQIPEVGRKLEKLRR